MPYLLNGSNEAPNNLQLSYTAKRPIQGRGNMLSKNGELGFAILAIAVMLTTSMAGQTQIGKQPFGHTADGTAVDVYSLKNKQVEVRIMTYGGIIVSLRTPDRNGKFDDVVLGFDSVDQYIAKNTPYFGALIGRYANRIAHGSFQLDGKTYATPKNNGDNTLHGGIRGFDKVVWGGKQIPDGIELSYVSKDGEEGFPGTLTTTVRYTLNGNALRIDYSASTDKDTVLNLTNHAYFDLAGQGTGDILGHVVKIDSDEMTPVDAGLIPTGELKSVGGTPFDFRKPHAVGERIDVNDEQLHLGRGYDHNFVLELKPGELKEAAEVYEPTSGRILQVLTDQPGVQLYSGNFLDGTITGKEGRVYKQRYGLCLETQHFPDSPNHPKFPSTELKPGEKFHSVTVYKFSAGSR
jgi:aldose 1-epimerase